MYTGGSCGMNLNRSNSMINSIKRQQPSNRNMVTVCKCESIPISSENLEEGLKVISESELKYIEVNKNLKDINEDTRTVMFTFLSEISLSVKQIKEMKIHLDNIFQNYNNFIYSSEVTVFPLI